MTALSDRIAAEHGVAWIGGSGTSETFGCTCGHRSTNDDPDDPFSAAHNRHVTDVTERAVRDAIVAELNDATSHVFYPAVGNPDSLTGKLYMQGVGAGIEFATLLAREGTTP